MKSKLIILGLAGVVYTFSIGCGAAKRGCPSNSSSMGAERVLGGEKPEKQSKFKIRGMN